jgi:hypothetical protein
VLYLTVLKVLIHTPWPNSLKDLSLLEPGVALMNSTELMLKYSLLLHNKYLLFNKAKPKKKPLFSLKELNYLLKIPAMYSSP